MYNLFDISDLAISGPKLLLIRDYMTDDEYKKKKIGMVGKKEDMEYNLQNDTLTVYIINPQNNTKTLNYIINLP